MKFHLKAADRVKLRQAVYTARSATVARRAQWILSIAGGVPIARLARLAGVSRPTVYRYLAIWLVTRDPQQLRSVGSGYRYRRSKELSRQIQHDPPCP